MMKVLLVDDEEKFAMMLAKRLKLRGIDTDYVYTGQDAMEMVKKNRYDVAILDVKMPGIGGIELERKLKAMASDMKIIFVTGHGSSKDFETGSEEAAYYLPKPLQIDELIRILHELTG
jgi:DNA-binding response OmpR family regulator